MAHTASGTGDRRPARVNVTTGHRHATGHAHRAVTLGVVRRLAGAVTGTVRIQSDVSNASEHCCFAYIGASEHDCDADDACSASFARAGASEYGMDAFCGLSRAPRCFRARKLRAEHRL